MLKLFCGYDPREAVGFHAFVQSVITQTTVPVQIIPLSGTQRDGTNAFTYARFEIPRLCDYQGLAVFADGSDMILRADLKEVLEHHQLGKAVSVVKHDYQPKSARKYIGTELEADNQAYPRKNWSSLAVWDCSNYAHRKLDPEKQEGSYLHRFQWLEDGRIGELPKVWNWLDEYGENPGAKLIHYTNGIPGFYEYRNAPHAEEWKDAVRKLTRGMS